MELKYLNHKKFGLKLRSFSSYIIKLKQAIQTLDGIINIVFVNDAYIKALNKSYRGKDKPTDVLSFNYVEERTDLSGEIYISVETAERQAIEHKHTLHDELIKLIIHGLLHIHGYDHEEKEDYEKMYAIEKLILVEIAGPYID